MIYNILIIGKYQRSHNAAVFDGIQCSLRKAFTNKYWFNVISLVLVCLVVFNQIPSACRRLRKIALCQSMLLKLTLLISRCFGTKTNDLNLFYGVHILTIIHSIHIQIKGNCKEPPRENILSYSNSYLQYILS